MLTHIANTYATLSPKGRAILSMLVADYERNGNEGLTRRQIAEQLGQVRLYPHDDRAIKRLDDEGFINISEQRLGELWADEYGDFRVYRRNHITRHTIYHVHWLNEFCYTTVRPLLEADGLYIKPQWGIVGDVLEAAENTWNRVLRWFAR
jgi:hypothetical protein